jgi:Ubiquitin-like modifier-activating enzyme ATG7 N-terminus
MAEDEPIRYAPWQSDLEFGFYAQLAALKIDKDRLDSPMRKVLGLYKIEQAEVPTNSMKMQIHSHALTAVE